MHANIFLNISAFSSECIINISVLPPLFTLRGPNPHLSIPAHTYFELISLLFHSLYFVLILALSLSACNNVNLFITENEQGKHLSSFFVISQSLNALSTFYVCFLSPLVTFTCPFVLLCILKEKKEKTLLKEEFYLVKYEWRRGVCGVFNRSCLTVWLTFYERALCTCLFGRKIKSTWNMLQHTISHTCILCYSSDVWSYLRTCHVQKQRRFVNIW